VKEPNREASIGSASPGTLCFALRMGANYAFKPTSVPVRGFDRAASRLGGLTRR